MNQELISIFLQVGKFVLASALLVIFYWIFYREKSTYNQSRFFLLTIVFISILVSQFKIVVYTPPTKTVEMEMPKPLTEISGIQKNEPQKLEKESIIENSKKPLISIESLSFLSAMNILIMVYSIITLILFLSLFRQYLKILSLKRNGNIIYEDGFKIVVNSNVPTPFSFGKTIFCGSNLSGKKLEMILKHEKFHIIHKHYIDVFAIEIIVRFFWFNPTLWWIRKELRSLSEFQSDRSVLDEGHDLYKYQTIILEEVMAYNPYFANGFNNSFTKKRFIMMKNKYNIRLTTLRRLLIMPFLVGIFSMLCFTTGKSQINYVEKTSKEKSVKTPKEKSAINSKIKSESKSKEFFEEPYVEKIASGPVFDVFTSDMPNRPRYGHRYYYTYFLNDDETVDKDVLKKAINDCSKLIGLALIDLENNSSNMEGLKSLINFLDIRINNKSIGDVVISDEVVSSFTPEEIKESIIILNDIKKKVDFYTEDNNSKLQSRLLDSQPQIGLINSQSQIGLIAFNYFLRNLSTAKVVSKITIPAMNNLVRQMGDTTASIVYTQITKKIIKDQKNDAMIWNNAYQAKPGQICISDKPYIKGERIISSIESNKKETKVTISIPIGSNEWWIRFDKSFLIIDKKTRDPYLIRRLDNDLPLNTTIKIMGLSNKVIDVTLIFPPLKESIELVDIEELITDKSEIMSSFGSPFSFKDVRISDHLPNKSKNIVLN